ncbi:MAG TPA: hypothetical protein VM370_02310 [Candidatus Thermoplasmatota archaeon]|nr:hypothetical protein [Candidatus Thermoplasmatota archaeon]
MSLRLIAALAAVSALLAAGCVTPNAADLQDASALNLDLKAVTAPLWDDPENAPHPGWNWPTLSSPPTGDKVPEWLKPIAPAALPDHIAGVSQLAGLQGDFTSGAGIAVVGGLVVVPGFGDKSHVVDIRDPANPAVLSEFESTQGGHRGAAIVVYPGGQIVTALSTGPGFELWDITDPTHPVQTAEVETPEGGHKVGIVPGTPILYNANSNGGGATTDPSHLMADQGKGVTEIYDLTDPNEPLLVQEFPNGFGCHHIYFWNTAEKQRTICAGIEFAQIWDTADPKNPVVIVSVPIPHGITALPSTSVFPVITPFAHFSILNTAGNILIVGDELGGGGLPPGCTVGLHTPARDVSAPTGALWFYDVSDETNPQLLSWYSPGHQLDPNGSPLTSCTAHHGRLVPDPEGRDMLAMSFYGAGVVLLDFSDPMAPQMIDQFYDGSDTWETWYYNGYLFTGDLQRGMDVLSFE